MLGRTCRLPERPDVEEQWCATLLHVWIVKALSGRFGAAIGMCLKNKSIRVLGVDFNPIVVRRWRNLAAQYRIRRRD